MKNKIAFITGATSGIGEACARKFAAEHYHLILCARREERLTKLSTELEKTYGIKVLPLVLDVRKHEALEVSTLLKEDWKNVDVLVNNAGLAVGLGPVHEGLAEDWDRMIDTNIKGLLYVTRSIVPLMVERGEGHVINIGSIAGKEPYLNGGVYCATKSAVEAITRSMRMELVRYGIRVSQVAPGAVETEFSLVRFKGNTESASAVYKGYQPLSAGDVANAVYHIASLPKHICINDMLIMPTAQANTVHWHKE